MRSERPTPPDAVATPSGVHPMYVDGEYYARHPTWDVEDSPWKAAQVRRLLDDHGLQPRSICEVGCGAGAILQELERTVPSCERLVGYEISPQAYELARRRESARLSFKLANLADEDAATSFDVLLIMDVVEHVEDYLGFLSDMRRRGDYTILYMPLDLSALALLRGKLAHWRADLGHLHYFTKHTALASLEHVGYEIVASFYARHATERPQSRRAAAIRRPRQMLTRVNEDLSQLLLGGASLVALAR